MDDFVTKGEFNATVEQLKTEDHRQNERLKELDRGTEKTNELLMRIDKLATNMENMCKEQERQGRRLDALESRDGEMWRKVLSYTITAIIGILVGFLFKQLGIV